MEEPQPQYKNIMASLCDARKYYISSSRRYHSEHMKYERMQRILDNIDSSDSCYQEQLEVLREQATIVAEWERSVDCWKQEIEELENMI